MNLIKGIHHVSLKCCNMEEFEKTVHFYGDVLGLKKVKAWDEKNGYASGAMFDTGAGLIEIFNDADTTLEKGAIRHFAFATDNVDACAEKLELEGYGIFEQPKDIEIPSEPPYPARVVFCNGPLGEEIEFFQEKIDSDVGCLISV